MQRCSGNQAGAGRLIPDVSRAELRRNHRFLPEPVIFPGYFGSIAVEVVNDWYHRTHKTDLMNWRRFTHLPVRYTDGNIRQTQRALAANMLFIGILQGDEVVVKHALKRLDQSMPKSGGVYRHDRASRGLLMFGHYVLGQQQVALQYEDPILKNILVP